MTQTKSDKYVCVFLAEGFETLEALSLVDVLRRAAVDVRTISITQRHIVRSAQGIPVQADMLLSEITDSGEIALIYIPGGMPGSLNLKKCPELIRLIRECYNKGAYIASICAGPMVLAEAGISQKHRGTCYPGCEETSAFKTHESGLFIFDNNVLTSRGPATALPFAYEILSVLKDAKTADQLRQEMQYKYLEKQIQERR